MSYVNTTAAVKALTDIVVTSGNAEKIIRRLPEDEKIIFGPDKNLGRYINEATGRHMLLWQGGCHVHARFKAQAIERLKAQHPGAVVMAHLECSDSVLALADVKGSTAVMLKYAQEHPTETYIVATEAGILHEMRKKCPETEFIPVPPEGADEGCNECEYMRMNTLEKFLPVPARRKPGHRSARGHRPRGREAHQENAGTFVMHNSQFIIHNSQFIMHNS